MYVWVDMFIIFIIGLSLRIGVSFKNAWKMKQHRFWPGFVLFVFFSKQLKPELRPESIFHFFSNASVTCIEKINKIKSDFMLTHLCPSSGVGNTVMWLHFLLPCPCYNMIMQLSMHIYVHIGLVACNTS